jgi:hypothetical protein
MAELPIGYAHGINPCYVYWVRLTDCYARESFGNLFCKNQYDDFIECKTSKRNVIIYYLLILLESF